MSELWNGDKTSGSFVSDNVMTLVHMLANSTRGTIDTISDNIDNASPNNQGIKMITPSWLMSVSRGTNSRIGRISQATC